MKHIVKIYAVVTILLLIGSQSLACSCKTLEKTEIEALMKKVDFVVIGRAVKNMHSNGSFRMLQERRQEGTDILLKVESVIKGDLAKDTIYINQYSQGSCIQVFQIGESYIVFGYKIKRFIKKEKHDNSSNALSLPALPVLKNSEMIIDEWDDKIIDFYNRQATKYVTITTNQCLTFYTDSEESKYIVK